MHSYTSSTAPDCDDARQSFEVTHPFHPLCGREFELVTYRHNWGENRVYFYDDQGRLKAIPAGWTNIGPDSLFEVISSGRSSFRTSDLLELVDLVAGLREIGHE